MIRAYLEGVDVFKVFGILRWLMGSLIGFLVALPAIYYSEPADAELLERVEIVQGVDTTELNGSYATPKYYIEIVRDNGDVHRWDVGVFSPYRRVSEACLSTYTGRITGLPHMDLYEVAHCDTHL